VSTISSNNIVVNYVVNSDALNKAADQFDNLTDAERASINETKKLNRALKETGDEGQKSTKNVKDGFLSLNNISKNLAGTLVGLFAIGSIKQFGAEVLATTLKYESLRSAIDFTSGSMQQGGYNMQFLMKTAEKLGISLDSAVVGFKTISGAASQAGYSGGQTRNIFENVSKAVSAFKLSGDDAKGVFLALGQMISKGTVASEELRGQIGERLPGAFSIAAKSMNVTEKELNKMLQSGKVTTREFLIPFTEALARMSESAAGKDGAAKRITLLQNAWESLLNTIGQNANAGGDTFFGGLINGFGKITKALNEYLMTQKQVAEQDFFKQSTKVQEEWSKASDEAIKRAMTSEKYSIQNLKNEIVQRREVNNEIEFNGNATSDTREEYLKLNKATEAEINLRRANLDGLFKLLEARKANGAVGAAIAAKTDKELKDEYKALLNIIDAQEKIAALKIEATTPDEFKQKQKLLENQITFNQKRLTVDRKYAKLGVDDAKLNGDLRVAENLKYNSDIVANEKKHNEEIKKKWDELTNSLIDKARKRGQLIQGAEEDRYKADVEMINNRRDIAELDIQAMGLAEKEEKKRIIQNNIKFNEEQIKIEEDAANKGIEGAQAKADKLKAINNKLNADLLNSDKMSAEERQAIVEKSVELASTLYQGFTDLYLANKSNELAATSAYYDEQIRLAGDNEQKKVELEEKKKSKEKEIRIEMFRAQQAAAVAQVIFNTAPIIAQQLSGVITAPLAALSYAIAAAQIGFILAQPVPAYKEGTKGKKHKGGFAYVGDGGESELITTPGGKSFWSPATTTLVDLPKGSQVFNQKQLSQELFLGTAMSRQGRQSNGSDRVVERLASIESALMGLPITQLNMDERGFEKYIRTPKRTTKILNNRFPSN